jgi:hypothetical protein
VHSSSGIFGVFVETIDKMIGPRNRLEVMM